MASSSSHIDSSLAKMVHKTLQTTLNETAGDAQWHVKNDDALANIPHTHCIVLTISSFKFRVMCIMHLSMNQNTRNFVANATNTKPQELDDSAFLDYLLELSNSLCGHLKRNLQGTCPPLGMSTPNFLERSSLVFEGILDIAHQAHASAMTAPNTPSLFSASALVSLLDEKDFEIQQYQSYGSDEDDESNVDNSGELELF